MGLTKWLVNAAGISEMLRDRGVAAHLDDAARAGLAKARASAPVVTGQYRDSLKVLEARTEGGGLVGSFGSDSWHWHFVEFGSINNRPYRTLGQAAEAVADRVTHT
jgi:HK97 gp10 family phage protein